MINPTISKLLSGVATSLDETVLPELEPGFARHQLVAAIELSAGSNGRRAPRPYCGRTIATSPPRPPRSPPPSVSTPQPRVDPAIPTLDDCAGATSRCNIRVAIHDSCAKTRERSGKPLCEH